MVKRLILIASILLLSACSGNHVTVKTDEFNKGVEILGIADFNNPFGVAPQVSYLWRLRSFINPMAHTVTHQAFLNIRYMDHPKNIKFATDENASILKVTPIYRTSCISDNCEKWESVGIAVDDIVLRQHMNTGYRIKAFAKSGNEFLLIFTSDMIRQQLNAVDKYIGNTH